MHTHKEKEQCIFDHFSTHFTDQPSRDFTLNWQGLGIQRHDLQSLELPFTEQEVWAVIQDMAAEKAPGPDGFIGKFFKSCWNIVKGDVMAALEFFFTQHDRHFKQLNTAHMVLVPKKLNPENVGDYRPISLTHSVAKLISKLLATRLAGKLNVLVSRAQSAFIKKMHPR